MKRLITLIFSGSSIILAQQPTTAPQQPMSFFITSGGSGKGADLGGLAGASCYWQALYDPTTKKYSDLRINGRG